MPVMTLRILIVLKGNNIVNLFFSSLLLKKNSAYYRTLQAND